jgi:hypothetical protein
MHGKGNLALFIALEIILLVTPMMFPTIPAWIGVVAYLLAFALMVYAVWQQRHKFTPKIAGWLPGWEKHKKVLPPLSTAAIDTAAIPKAFAGMKRVYRNDFDLIPAGMNVYAVRGDDGTDIWVHVHYRNRASRPRATKFSFANYELDGKKPEKEMTRGMSSPIPAERNEGVNFQGVRVYSEDGKLSGFVELGFQFGETWESMRTALHIRYDFTVKSRPTEKAKRTSLEFDWTEDARYYQKLDP